MTPRFTMLRSSRRRSVRHRQADAAPAPGTSPTRRTRLALAASVVVLGASGTAAPGASAASTVHHAYGNGPFRSVDCTKNLDYGEGGITYRLCMQHKGTTVTAGYTISTPGNSGTGSFHWTIVGHAYTPGSPDRTYERFFAKYATKAGYNVSAWVTRGGVPSNVCAATTLTEIGTRSPRRNGNGKAC